MRSAFSAIAVSAFVFVVSLTQSGDAHAIYRLFHASQCASTGDYTFNYASNGQVLSAPTFNGSKAICPVTTDGNFAPPETATISVDGYQQLRSPPSSFTAAACRVYRGGGELGGKCGTSANASTFGAVAHLAPSASGIWTAATANDARFILVGLGGWGADGGPGADAIWSYRVSY